MILGLAEPGLENGHYWGEGGTRWGQWGWALGPHMGSVQGVLLLGLLPGPFCGGLNLEASLSEVALFPRA